MVEDTGPGIPDEVLDLKTVLRQLAEQREVADAAERREMTILVADIRNFTTLSEAMSPERNFEFLNTYLGRNPAEKTFEEAAGMRARQMAGFEDVPPERWADEVRKHYRQTDDGLTITYDPKLRDAFLAVRAAPAPDLWPLFEAMNGLPIALIRGANSDLLSKQTADEMARRRPDMIRAEVPGRGHVPFLDEPEALDAIHEWLECLG